MEEEVTQPQQSYKGPNILLILLALVILFGLLSIGVRYSFVVGGDLK